MVDGTFEHKNYGRQKTFSNMRVGKYYKTDSKMVIYFWGVVLGLFFMTMYLQNEDFGMILKMPFFYIGIVFFGVTLFILLKYKTTVKGVKPLHEIISSMFSIVLDSRGKKQTQKNKKTLNELKEIQI